MREAKQKFPEISLWFTYLSILFVFLSSFIFLLPFIPLYEDCFVVPFLTEEFEWMIRCEFSKSRFQQKFLVPIVYFS